MLTIEEAQKRFMRAPEARAVRSMYEDPAEVTGTRLGMGADAEEAFEGIGLTSAQSVELVSHAALPSKSGSGAATTKATGSGSKENKEEKKTHHAHKEKDKDREKGKLLVSAPIEAHKLDDGPMQRSLGFPLTPTDPNKGTPVIRLLTALTNCCLSNNKLSTHIRSTVRV